MNNTTMNMQLGKKWFIFYTKIRPWLTCIAILPTIIDFTKYSDTYFSNLWLFFSFTLAVTERILAIMVFLKSREDYIEFVDFVKGVLLFETFSMAYQQGVRQYVNTSFDIVSAFISFTIMFLCCYFIWYRLNIKYFKKRIVLSISIPSTAEIHNNYTDILYCAHCGNKLIDHVSFCPYCGTKIIK